jgi:hypothetical protein
MTQLFVFMFFLISGFSYSQAANLFIDDSQTLAQLETKGFDIARLVFNETASKTNNELLVKNASYAFIAKNLAAEIEELKKEDPKLFISMRGSHRLIDSQWLISNYANYELVGVVNRMDRLSFHQESCGEIRFIYRLAYNTTTKPSVYSRLPMTINSVFWIPASSDNCREPLKKWTKFTSTLERSDLPLGDLKSIEVNMQSVRWPSTIRPDMAGYAEYLLRVFNPKNGKLNLGTLENTPDVKKILADRKLREELLTWLKDKNNLQNIDAGISLIPEKFLAIKATSVALQGTHRLHNASFTQLFKSQDFSENDLKNYNSFKNSTGLLRRLNDLSCIGCHQGRTVAGFHFLGKDKSATDAVNSIFTSSSPHFLLDQERRNKFIDAIQKKESLPHVRPLSVRAVTGEGNMGSHCGLGDPSFAAWTCNAGFECKSFTEDKLISPTGICVPLKKISGSPCTAGQMVHNVNSKKDSLKLQPSLSCGDNYVCEASSVGFPNGMCAGSCKSLKSGETCGSIAVLNEFNNCLAEGKRSFAKCLGENVRAASMQECSSYKFCRDDYICAKTSQGKGSCIPPYFLFQLRVDGHPSPGLGKEKFTFLDRLKKLLPD